MNNVKTDFRIIIIDDNVAIHADFKKILQPSVASEIDSLSTKIFGIKREEVSLPNFQIDTASQGQEGVARIKEALHQGRPYSLAFVDIRMPPGWDGIETIKHIWELDKDIQVVICTAYSDYSWEETVANLGKTDNLLVLKKPFDNVSIRQLACALTRKWQLMQDSRQYTHSLKKQVEDRTLSLQKSLSLTKSTFESSNDGILVVNNEGSIIDYNQKLVSMLGIPQKVLEAKNEKDFLDSLLKKLENREEFLQRINEFRHKTDEISIDVLYFKNGNIFECYSQPHKLNKKIIGRILDFRDITKRAQLEQKLQYQATHDFLTGLGNRVYLLEKMQQAIKLAEKNQTRFAVLFFDLDRFKLVNDSLSHEAGDRLLQATANRLKKIARSQDTLVRLGGDEFIFLLMDIGEEKYLSAKARQLLGVFQKPFSIDHRNIVLTASLGISIYPKDGTKANVLLSNADAAMYQAKAQKGNNFTFYSPEMNTHNLAILDQEIELRQAIANNEFFLCYQPQLDVSAEKLVAVEALLRWRHPKKGVLLPMDFVPLAEETGLIIPIGEWVLRTACAQNKAWQDAGFPPIRVAVNVTAQQFRQKNLIEVVKHVLQETGLQPKYLELELTENVILSNLEVIKMVTELKKLGISIAIDDFGTGYSSLSYLHKIPLDRLKIDSSFIKHIQSETDDEAIIRAVIAMAKNLHLEVLAEGVETKNQLNFLKKYQCADVQGFYFSEPLSIKDLEYFFKHPDNIYKLTNKIPLDK